MAKKFKFSLDAVLNLKSYRANEAKDMLNQAVNIRRNKEAHIESQHNYLDDISKNMNGNNNLQDIQALHYHKSFIENNIEKLEKEKFQIIEIENLRRNKLSEAMKEEKVLEKLKEKKKFQYDENIKKEEGYLMDEVASRMKSVEENDS